jgi:hypothetical protein
MRKIEEFVNERQNHGASTTCGHRVRVPNISALPTPVARVHPGNAMNTGAWTAIRTAAEIGRPPD